jgi:dihydroxy-acid dehydratase
VREGDSITVDADRGVVDLEITPQELAARLAAWKQPALRYTTGVFAKYCALVASASEGAITRPSQN